MVKTLIVEDDRILADRLNYTVRQLGSEVETAYSFQHALEICRQTPVDLLITDVVLGDLDNGLDLAERIKTANRNLSMIVITAFGSPETEERSEALGAALYLEKPVDQRVLRQCLQVAIDRCALQKQIRNKQDPESPEVLEEDPSSVDALWLAIMGQLVKRRPLKEISGILKKGNP